MTPSHSHHHDAPAPPASHRLRRVIAAVLVPFALAVLAGLIALWPGSEPAGERSGIGFDQERQRAKVTKVEEVKCADVGAQIQEQGPPGGGDTDEPRPDEDAVCEQATIEVTSGKHAGRTFTEIVAPDASRRYEVGQELVVSYSPKAPRELQYAVSDVVRTVPMTALALVFAVAVVVVGRLRGLAALAALAVSFAILILFILPAILDGSNPLVVAVVGGSAIMLIALYLCHGFNVRTSVAALGTLASLMLIGLLGSLFIGWSKLTGNTDDFTGLIHTQYPDIDMSGLLLAGVLIGSLGVLDDVTVTQASAVWELRQADPSAPWRKLYASAMRIGRDHIASVVNTLVLAYAGAALPLLLLFTIADQGVGTVATSEFVAEEIVRTLVGSIGLVASVPLTTGLAALVVSADRRHGAGPAPVPGAAPGGGTGPGAGTGTGPDPRTGPGTGPGSGPQPGAGMGPGPGPGAPAGWAAGTGSGAAAAPPEGRSRRRDGGGRRRRR
ncbi:YibE/F family protein [Streptomyces sp. NBC_01808]|uniref:YibE/F family protein n=1 Tax=Streptomyces sp. NBC_01808 TaxID=2975947 RepID=UPI002DDA70FA|nr:YibE/F family protein [Streptomyces sp. NBC_01808]WSA38997.1 YibE/F family protein [Streptomyces sp. NBC_01808]